MVTVETATVPLDMYYSRASNFGDDWDEQDICATAPEDSWYPSASVVCEEGEVELRWDWLENGDDLGYRGQRVWQPERRQVLRRVEPGAVIGVDENGEEIYTNMDTQFRRIFYNLGYVDTTPSAAILYISDSVVAHTRGGDLVLAGSW